MNSDLPTRAASSGGNAARRQPVRLFKSDLLEHFTRARVTTLILFWLPVSLGALVLGVHRAGLGAGAIVGVVGAGALGWTLCEYLLHRFVFHLDRWIPQTARLCFLIHGCHHVDPADASRDIMPLAASVPLFAGVLAAAIELLGDGIGLAFFGTFALAYLAYDVIHYGCHQWRLPGRFGAYLKRYHLAHHYIDDGRHFGVTSPLWDLAFGTFQFARRHA